MQPKVLIAILHCDRKKHNQMHCLPSVYGQQYSNFQVYHNIETTSKENFLPLMRFATEQPIATHYDFWQCESTWWQKPTFDQDQARLVPICEGRNRAIDCALDTRAEYLLFVDADMVIPPNTITQLMARNKHMVGGYVRGRNDHKSAEYIFGSINGVKEVEPGLIECDHGNIGFVLLTKKVFEVLRFRRGRHCTLGHLQSDDPNYCFDWLNIWQGQRFYVDKNVPAHHIDETQIPFMQGAQY